VPNVVNKRRGSFIGAGVEFKPGTNEVSEDVLLRVFEDASVASWFALGFLVLDDAGKAEALAVSPSPAVEDAPAPAPESYNGPGPGESPEVVASQPKRRRRGG
jgi:hypothetical protein